MAIFRFSEGFGPSARRCRAVRSRGLRLCAIGRWTTGIGNPRRRQHAVSDAAAALVRIVSLVALLIGGTVPTGMMRISQAGEGLRMVLCTPEGPKEFWLAEDGNVAPISDTRPQDGKDHAPSACVQITLMGLDRVSPGPDPFRWAHAFTLPWRFVDQIVHRPARERPQRSRAPPLPA